MWKNFAAAMALLTVAMLSALYSSGVARMGRMTSAAIAAIIALSIAIWVAVRFVPRLASNVEWDWFPFLTQYHVTREGWIYFAGVIVVIFAAINTNNNLLYMVLSALMAVLLVSGFLSAVNFRLLKLELRTPANAFVGASFPIKLHIDNQKNVFPSFSLMVETVAGAGVLFQPFYVAGVTAKSRATAAGEGMLSQRGLYSIRKVKVRSRHPFGFFLKARDYNVEAECICYPEIISLEELNLSASDLLGANQRFQRGLGNDLYMIRNYLPVDSARHVHWKASAKTGALKTREFAAEDSRRLAIHFDRFADAGEQNEFERLVSYTASVAVHLIREGIEVALLTDEFTSGFGCNPGHLENILRYLALVQPSPTVVQSGVDTGSSVMILSLRHPQPYMFALEAHHEM